MHTLYLTPAERRAFEMLSPALREGVSILDEVPAAEDSPEALDARLQAFTPKNPQLKALRDRAKQCGNDEAALGALLQGADTEGVDETDWLEFYCTLGPSTLSVMIGTALGFIRTTDDVATISSLTIIRHGLQQLRVFTPSTPHA